MAGERRHVAPVFSAAGWPLVLPARPAALPTVRRELRHSCSEWGWSAVELVDVVLAVHEAVANVIDHAYPTQRPGVVEVHLLPQRGARLLITVTDHGQWREPAPHTGGRGRGLPLMRACMETVTITPKEQGTEVRMRTRTRRRTGDPAGPAALSHTLPAKGADPRARTTRANPRVP